MARFETAQISSLAAFHENAKLCDDVVGRRFRFVGLLTRFDPIDRRGYLEHQGYSICLNLSLVSTERVEVGSVIQVMGVIQQSSICVLVSKPFLSQSNLLLLRHDLQTPL